MGQTILAKITTHFSLATVLRKQVRQFDQAASASRMTLGNGWTSCKRGRAGILHVKLWVSNIIHLIKSSYLPYNTVSTEHRNDLEPH